MFFAGLLVALAAAALESSPGYMDADYYFAGGLRVLRGEGSTEPYLWNYLNSPIALPVRSFAYWMPLSAYLAAAGMSLAGSESFWAARISSIFLAALAPLLTATLAYRMTGQERHARLAGIFALFPGFYLAYMTTTDSFPVSMVFGSLFLLIVGGSRTESRLQVRSFGLGILCGLMHMLRADGLMWLIGGAAAAMYWSGPFPRLSPLGTLPGAARALPAGLRRFLCLAGAVLAGYFLISLPWYARNLQEWSALFPPGGSRAMWITEYEQTMIYPASLLSPQHWLAADWKMHFNAWGKALVNNLQTAVAVQGGVALAPFIVLGAWKLRDRVEVRAGGLMWLLTAGVMTIVFPFAGINGSFYHSGAAVQPLLWAIAPVGVEAGVTWYARKRRLPTPYPMMKFVSILLVAVSILLSGGIYFQRVIGLDPDQRSWNTSLAHYQVVEIALTANGAQPDEAVMVNNPPGYWLASRRPAIVIPYGDEQMLLSAAQQYQARYLVLETMNPGQLSDLYHGRIDPPELEFLAEIDTTRLYRIRLSGK